MSLFAPQPKAPFTGVQCERCAMPLAFRPRAPTPDARIMRHAQQPQGVCATCGFRIWLATDYGGAIEEIIRRDCKGDATVLQLPHVQAIIRNALVVGKCDAPFEEIDFARLVEQWDLPMPK